MSRLLRLRVSIIFLSLVPVPALAEDWPCYRLEFDSWSNKRPNWFIIDRAGDLVLEWIRDDELIILETRSIGTGIQLRQAIEPNGAEHSYRMVDDKLVFDMDVYEPGCERQGRDSSR
ncbi:hypothetical protein ACHMW7_09160 [Aminobacter sp. UC22_36]|uniref:hypothetical protein n=1 Tax=Aminobacter sp. UC22_36 TaxID=3374549 RepID=UPI00375683C0